MSHLKAILDTLENAPPSLVNSGSLNVSLLLLVWSSLTHLLQDVDGPYIGLLQTLDSIATSGEITIPYNDEHQIWIHTARIATGWKHIASGRFASWDEFVRGMIL